MAQAPAEPELDAQDLVYEASDAIDAAMVEFRAGRDLEADRLLTRAEEFLARAERLEPGLGRISYQRARLLKLDGSPDQAEEVLLAAMVDRLEIADHVQAVTLLDSIRLDLGSPSIAVEWRRARLSRDLGLGLAIGGALASIVGYSLAFASLAAPTYAGEAADPALQQAGLGIAIAGGGISLGGGILGVGGTIRIGKIEKVLPGPGRLRGESGPARSR